nr:hypothetical protein [Ardenticatena sp.]
MFPAMAWTRRFGKVLVFTASILLFALGIVLMKDGARSLTPLIERWLDLRQPWQSLAAGWVASMVIMSGSPIAAVALTLLDSGLMTALSAFTMIMGSRFGASFIVLCVGFIYALRGRSLLSSLSMGLLSFAITISLHVMGLLPGIWLLQTGWLTQVPRPRGVAVTSVVDVLFEPVRLILSGVLPLWSFFGVGFVLIMLSFALLDQALPTESLKAAHFDQIAQFVYRPSIMFVLGALVTLVSMSVSLSVSILVPLSDRGVIRRENVIPYIMGANITTFVDTLLASLLMETPHAFDVVLAEMVSVAAVALFILLFAFRPYEIAIERFVEWVAAHPSRVVAFLVMLFAVPILGLFAG